jgi:aspartate racemase
LTINISMKKIGLIGGVGPESSIEYYRLIIKRFQERLDTKDYPEIIINSINMTEMLSFVFNNQLDQLTDFLADKIVTLQQAGVDFAAIASNTPHMVFDRLNEKVSLPMISIVEETCRFIKFKGLRKVGLFGTKSTMTKGFYQKAAGQYGIELIIPVPEDQDYIHEKYMTELVFNKIEPDTKNRLLQIAGKLIDKESIEGLILGGTELPLILNQSDFNDIMIFDTTKIHVESIVSKMIEY